MNGAGSPLLDPIGQAPWPMRLLGRVVDAHGQPMDRLGSLADVRNEPMVRRSINAMDRDPIRTPLDTGVRAINAMLTVGRGQRIGLFAGTGVGKSVLLGMMARFTAADVIVLGLIGERGREVKEFIENILGEQGRAADDRVLVLDVDDAHLGQALERPVHLGLIQPHDPAQVGQPGDLERLALLHQREVQQPVGLGHEGPQGGGAAALVRVGGRQAFVQRLFFQQGGFLDCTLYLRQARIIYLFHGKFRFFKLITNAAGGAAWQG